MRHLVVLLVALAGCAHKPLSAASLDETRLVAFIARIEDEAGPKSNVFRNDSSYRPQLKRLDDKEGDRRLGNVLAAGSFNKKAKGQEPELTHHTISRFEIADSLRSNTLSQLPKHSPWSEVVHPVDVARVLESFLVQEVPANAPDYERLAALGADTVVEIVVEEYGMRSEKGRAGAYLVGFARMFRVGGAELYHRKFYSDDLSADLPHLDPFAVNKNAELFADRIQAMIIAISAQVAKDLTPEERREAPTRTDSPRRPKNDQQQPQADDPL
jgi:hypothetical protein